MSLVPTFPRGAQAVTDGAESPLPYGLQHEPQPRGDREQRFGRLVGERDGVSRHLQRHLSPAGALIAAICHLSVALLVMPVFDI